MALYVLLGYGPRSVATAEPGTGDSVSRLTSELVAREELVYAVGLADAAFAQVVTVREGRATVAEGAYHQAPGELSSLSVVDVTSHDRALQVAARTAALLGPVELRPIAGGTHPADGDTAVDGGP